MRDLQVRGYNYLATIEQYVKVYNAVGVALTIKHLTTILLLSVTATLSLHIEQCSHYLLSSERSINNPRAVGKGRATLKAPRLRGMVC